MASCNLSYSGHTGVLVARAYVTELSSSGSSRYVNLRVTVYAQDYSGARDGGYSVSCSQSGTNVSVPIYNGFTITGSEKEIFNESFYVTASGWIFRRRCRAFGSLTEYPRSTDGRKAADLH